MWEVNRHHYRHKQIWAFAFLHYGDISIAFQHDQYPKPCQSAHLCVTSIGQELDGSYICGQVLFFTIQHHNLWVRVFHLIFFKSINIKTWRSIEGSQINKHFSIYLSSLIGTTLWKNRNDSKFNNHFIQPSSLWRKVLPLFNDSPPTVIKDSPSSSLSHPRLITLSDPICLRDLTGSYFVMVHFLIPLCL